MASSGATDSGRSLGRESTSSARSVDLGHLESIELCCGPTTCCGHHNLPEARHGADDLVDERTRTRARRGARCCCGLRPAGRSAGLCTYVLALRQRFENRPQYVKLSRAVPFGNASMTKAQMLSLYFNRRYNVSRALVDANHCDTHMLEITARGHIDTRNCGPDAQRFGGLYGCRAGFYQPRNQTPDATATTASCRRRCRCRAPTVSSTCAT